MAGHTFHLSIAVTDLDTARKFYVDVLGARVGRVNEQWVDILIWGHQITLHQQPHEVPPRGERGVRHFGVVLPWEEWASLGKRLDAHLLSPPTVKHEGTQQEQGKFYLEDPSGNVIEIKAYRDFDAVFGVDPRA